MSSVANQITLDTKHLEKCEYFNKIETVEIPKLEKQYNDLIQKKSTQLNVIQAEAIKNRIYRLREEKDNYYKDNLVHIFNYFETKKNIETLNAGQNKTSKEVAMFFGLKKQQNDSEIEKQHNLNSSNIMKQYLSNIDKSYIDTSLYITHKNMCNRCHNGEWIMYDEDNFMVCNNCKSTRKFLVQSDNLTQSEKSKEVSSYAYKRINHFKEIVSQFQGKETTQIEEHIFDLIKAQIKRERYEITSEHLTYDTMKNMLKKLKLNKYYEHIPYIKHRLGIEPPLMSQELEEKLYKRFSEIQTPYSKHCPDNRTNFLNYYFTLYKLCELEGEFSFLKEIPMLKDKDKRVEQSNIWYNICKDLNWTIYSSE
jgi:hypothetical protein